jgi:hypothetical protein
MNSGLACATLRIFLPLCEQPRHSDLHRRSPSIRERDSAMARRIRGLFRSLSREGPSRESEGEFRRGVGGYLVGIDARVLARPRRDFSLTHSVETAKPSPLPAEGGRAGGWNQCCLVADHKCKRELESSRVRSRYSTSK